MNVTDLSIDLQKEFKQRQYFAQMDVLEQTSSLLIYFSRIVCTDLSKRPFPYHKPGADL